MLDFAFSTAVTTDELVREGRGVRGLWSLHCCAHYSNPWPSSLLESEPPRVWVSIFFLSVPVARCLARVVKSGVMAVVGLTFPEHLTVYKAQHQALNFSSLILTLILLAQVGVDLFVISQMKKLKLGLGVTVDLPTFEPAYLPLKCVALSTIYGRSTLMPRSLDEVVFVDICRSVSSLPFFCAFLTTPPCPTGM